MASRLDFFNTEPISDFSTYCETVVRQVCGLFGNLKKNENIGQLRQRRDPLHNFQPDPQEEVDSETKVIVVFLLQLGKV